MTDALTVLRELRGRVADLDSVQATEDYASAVNHCLEHIDDAIARLEREQAEAKPVGRPESVQRIMAYLKRRADYRDGVPKDWMKADHGDESAMIRYVEELEKR